MLEKPPPPKVQSTKVPPLKGQEIYYFTQHHWKMGKFQ